MSGEIDSNKSEDPIESLLNRKMTRREVLSTGAKIAIGVAAVAAVGGGAAAYYYSQGSTSNPKPQTIKIGLLADLTGFAVQYGGPEYKNAIQLLVDQLNATGGVKGVPLELVVVDSQSSSDGYITGATELMTRDNVVGFMGGFFSSLTLGSIHLPDQYQTPWVAAGGTTPNLAVPGAKWFFHTLVTVPTIYSVLADFINNVIKPKVAPGRTLRWAMEVLPGVETVTKEAILSRIANFGYDINLVDFETTTFTQTDYSAELDRMAATKPDVVFFQSLTTQIILQQALAKGMRNNSVIILDELADSQAFYQAAGDNAKYTLDYYTATAFAPSYNPTLTKFIQDYTNKYNSTPTVASYTIADSFDVLVGGLKNAGQPLLSDLSSNNLTGAREKLRQALDVINIPEYLDLTPTGVQVFDPSDLQGSYTIGVMQVQNPGTSQPCRLLTPDRYKQADFVLPPNFTPWPS